jgi:prepilin-type N-terminal cleavage/methylation domain-containing protein
MKATKGKTQSGFSLIELLVAMTVMLILLGIVSTILGRSMSVRSRESRKSDALASAEAALNVLSRELSNAGYGIYSGLVVDDPTSGLATNGIYLPDSNSSRVHFRANLTNTGGTSGSPGPTAVSTNDPGEDVTYFFDSGTQSIVRYDPNGGGTGVPETSVIINKISNVTFQYWDYTGLGVLTGPNNAPSANTGRVTLTVTVVLDPVIGQPNTSVTYTSDVTLRNVDYMLRQY